MDFLTQFDAAAIETDWGMDGFDIATDQGLQSAVLISLFTDRLAEATDVLPAPTPQGQIADRRGWWGDSFADLGGFGATSQPDHIGSRLWLLNRAKATVQNAALAQAYVQEALQWLIDDGVAQGITVTTEWLLPAPLNINSLQITIVIAQSVAGGGTVNKSFNVLWQQAANDNSQFAARAA